MHIFVFLCMAFMFGCFCGIKFAASAIFCFVFSFFIVFIIKLILFNVKTVSNLKIFALVTVFSIGALLGIFHDRNTFNDIQPFYGTDITVTGTISEVKDNSFLINTKYGFLRAYNYRCIPVKNNDTATVTGNLSAYSTSQYKGGFDGRLYYGLKGIVGMIDCQSIEVTGYNTSFSMWNIGASIRYYIETKVFKFPCKSKVKGFIAALLTGNTDYLDNNVKESFRLTGISHLIAVSGLHVSIFISFFWLLTVRLRKSRFLHLLFILTLIIMYTIVIGERASVFRAGIMAVCSYAMFSMKKRSDSLMNLMIAGLLICFVNPYYMTDAGFQMSFLATLGIILFSHHFKHSVIATPAVATLFMLPVTVYYSNTISLETILVNIIAVPLVPSIILFGYIGCFVPFVSSISCVIANIVISIAEFFASMDFLHITVQSPDLWRFVLWVFLICSVYSILNRQSIAVIMIFVFLTTYFTVNTKTRDTIPEGIHRLRFINSGNYNMMHLTTADSKDILIDCGLYSNDYAIKNRINEFYMVVITENSESRYAGLEKLCKSQKVHNVLLPNDLKSHNLKLEKCKIMYYNQYRYNFSIDDIQFKFAELNDVRCMLIKLYDNVLAMPFGTEISQIGNYKIMCVPDKCTDCDKAATKNKAKYYIHPTYRYKYYDYGTKYITPQVGMITIDFHKNNSVRLKTR